MAIIPLPLDPFYRKFFSQIARLCCQKLVRSMPPPRVIMNRAGDSAYLERYYLVGGPSEEGEFQNAPLTVMLHRFARSDEPGELHSHPWEMSVSFVLAGGYREERRLPDESVETKEVLPFDLNLIGQNDFHRVDLLENECWTLFVTGRKVASWAFWNRDTKQTTPWRDFIAKKRGVLASVANAKKSECIGR
ncbi:MAG: hypothetical protein ACYCPT_01885 [Acidimicrobiales bacterium]